MTERRNLLPVIGLAAITVFLLYGWSVAGAGAAGSPIEVLGVLGTILMFVAILATFATMAIAARRAFLAGSWLWFAVVIFIWPLSYVYTLAVNRRG